MSKEVKAELDAIAAEWCKEHDRAEIFFDVGRKIKIGADEKRQHKYVDLLIHHDPERANLAISLKNQLQILLAQIENIIQRTPDNPPYALRDDLQNAMFHLKDAIQYRVNNLK